MNNQIAAWLLKGRKNRCQFVTLIILNPRNHLLFTKGLRFYPKLQNKMCNFVSDI